VHGRGGVASDWRADRAEMGLTVEAGDGFQQRGLAAAGGPYAPDHLTRGERQGDVPEDRAALVAAGQRLERDDGFIRRVCGSMVRCLPHEASTSV
jgi:hypothetical protein